MCVFICMPIHLYSFILSLIHYLLNYWKEGNASLNDTLKMFYLWLYGFRYMVKDHSDSERGNQLLLHGLLFIISSKGYFICTIPQTG